mgnify:FL=1
MKQILFIITILIFASSACQPVTGDPVNQNPSYPNPSYPNPSAPQTGDFAPQPGDADLLRGEVYLDSTELLTLESFPLQFMLSLKGNLPTPCSQLRVKVSPSDSEKRVAVDVYSVLDPAAMCAQVLQSFDVNIPLGSFPEGKYTLWVNGEMVAEFQS